MKIRNIMTHKIQTINRDTTIKEAALLMRDFNIGVLPVINEDKLIGLLTDRDIVVRALAKGSDPNTARAGDFMTVNVETCFEDDFVEEAAERMENLKVRRMPVLSLDYQLVGIVSLSDLMLHGNKEKACEVLEKVSQLS